MTPKQQKTIEQLKIKILDNDGLNRPESYEYKQFEFQDCGSFISLITEVGRIGDEGTLASLFRVHRHIFIGKNGGLELANPAKWVKGKKVPMKGRLKGYRAIWWPTY